ncbi:MAG TPA: PqqD family protein [Clostridiales bacterium]|nr:PqqD family protein [Clostridiales bacterium]HPV01896.1 PqqD family protein [Clostridiales bacterium]
MKTKKGFLLRKLAGQWVVVPIGQNAADFSCILMLSESGARLWERLSEGADDEGLVKVLLDTYDIDEETARNDVREFIENVEKQGLLE